MLVNVGFNQMIIELSWLLGAYSIYLTLREWLIILYFCTLAAGGICKFNLMSGYAQTALLFVIIEIVFLFLGFWYVLVSYWSYR